MQKNRTEPFKVICVKNTSKLLIKGSTYTAVGLHTNHNNKRRVSIKDVGNYSIDYFTLINGQSLENISDFSSFKDYLDPKTKDYTNNFVRCRYSGNSKIFKEGEIYLIEKQILTVEKGWNNQLHDVIKFKVRGVNNLVTTYRFEEIPISEQRNLKLKNLNGEVIKTGEQTRKFLMYSESQKIEIILELITRVLIDINKTESTENVNIIKLILNKGKNYAILEEDILPYLNLSLKNLIDKTVSLSK